MIIHSSDPELIEKLILSGWARSEDCDVTFYWPGPLPRAS